MIPPVDAPQANKGGTYSDTALRDQSQSDPAKHVRADLAAFGTASPSTTPAPFAPIQSVVLASPNAGQPPLSNRGCFQPTPSPHSEHLAADPTAPSLKSTPPAASAHDHTKVAPHPPTADLRGQNAPQETAPLTGQIRNASQNTAPHPSSPVTGPIPLVTAQTQVGTIGTLINPVDDSAGLNDAAISTDDPKFELTTSHLREASQPSQPTRTLPDLPRHIAAQLAEIVRTAPDKPVELTLNPEELGRLRMSFQTDASSLTVVLQVERPETLDLMRRHIEQLAQDMHDLGYEQVNFTFQQQQQDAASNGQAGADPDTRSTPRTDGHGDQPVAQDKVQIHISPGAGMDIRI
nr:flagellar hook-length control protein FliK [Aliiroseovarius sp. S2029]